MKDLCKLLRDNPYPGRGMVLGRSAGGECAVLVYFIMGRSVNSRNRIFEPTPDGIRTRAFDESKMTDPSLIIYHPVRVLDGTFIVTNGDQTDTIADAFRAGKGFVRALRTRTFEPDAPNYTPRISGMVRPDGSYRLSILKSAEGTGESCVRFFFEYDAPTPGVGHFISTYQGDGDPLPSFAGEPVAVDLSAPDAATLAKALWDSLNGDNKISLYVNYVNIKTGAQERVILNKLEA